MRRRQRATLSHPPPASCHATPAARDTVAPTANKVERVHRSAEELAKPRVVDGALGLVKEALAGVEQIHLPEA